MEYFGSVIFFSSHKRVFSRVFLRKLNGNPIANPENFPPAAGFLNNDTSDLTVPTYAKHWFTEHCLYRFWLLIFFKICLKKIEQKKVLSQKSFSFQNGYQPRAHPTQITSQQTFALSAPTRTLSLEENPILEKNSKIFVLPRSGHTVKRAAIASQSIVNLFTMFVKYFWNSAHHETMFPMV